MISFLEVNGIDILLLDEEIENLAIKIADGTYTYSDVYNFLYDKC